MNNGGFAIIVSGFPRTSETFIYHELEQLRETGSRFFVFAMKEGNLPVEEAVRRYQSINLSYLPQAVHLRMIGPLLQFLFRLLLKRPVRTTRVLARFLQTGPKERNFSLFQSLVRLLWLSQRLDLLGIDRVHSHFAHDPTTFAYWSKKLCGPTFSFTAHAKDIYCYPESSLIEKIREAEFVVTCTQYNQHYLQNLSNAATPVYCVHHGVRTNQLGTPAASRRNRKIILAVARLVDKKGLDDLISACAILRGKGINFHCIIAGDGPLYNILNQQVRQLNLEKQVSLIGEQPHADVLKLYRKASVFALPSVITEQGDRDGIPNVILEAMECALPVVSTYVSGIPEAVIHGKTGLLVAERDPQQLAKALRQLLENPAIAVAMGEAGRVFRKKHFDLEKNVADLKELLEI